MKNFLKDLIRFMKGLFFVIIYLGGLAGIMILADDVFHNEGSAVSAMWFYLGCSLVGYVYFNNRKSFTKENFKKFIEITKIVSKKLLKSFWYFILAIIGIIILFFIGGWIAGLSATTIIIILLILILLK